MRSIPRFSWSTGLPRLAVLVLLLAGRGAAAPSAAGAECIDCHEAVVRGFATNPHARAAHAAGEVNGSCASCHEGAAEHAQSGDPAQVLSFHAATAERATEACLECHRRGRAQLYWRGSAHERNEVSCTECHAVHPNRPRLLARADEPETCFECHFDVRSDLTKRSTHAMRAATRLSTAAQLTCSSCHNPHGAPARALIDARSVNDKCYECHADKQAPVLWEHSPVKEDCLSCHRAHGSPNENLLVSRVPRLCQECHLQGRHQSGTLSPSSTFAFNRSCLNCHPQIHGSNSPSGAVLQR